MLTFLAVSWCVLLGILIAGMYSVNSIANVTKEALQNNLTGLATSFAVAIKDAGHEKITLETPEDDPLYTKILRMMSAWQDQISVTASIYTCRKDAEGNIIFICCPPADLNRDRKIQGEKEQLVPKGKVYEFESKEDIFEIFEAFEGMDGFNRVPVADEWGKWITAAVPIYDETNKHVDAILGVDFREQDWHASIRHAVFWPELFFLLSVALFFVVQMFIIRRQIIEEKLTQYAAHLEQITEELVEAKKAADIAIQAKSFFLANISHEIRTPMSAILGCIDMLVGAKKERPAQFDQTQLVNIIRKSSQNLMTIIDDVLTYSSIDTNRIALEAVPIDLRQLMEDVKIMAGSLFEEKPQLKFHIEWGDSVPNLIIGDPARIRQILLALISNAVKFTEAGHIIVKCSCILLSEESEYGGAAPLDAAVSQTTPFLNPHIAQAKGLRGMISSIDRDQASHQTTVHLSQTLDTWKSLPNALLLRIDILDTGIGIAREQFSKLFKPFSQIDETSTRKFGGVGLGLSIVKGLVQLMGGDVLVTSKVGYGSTFSVLIPVSGREDSVVRRKQQQRLYSQTLSRQGILPLQDYHILAVDDVVVNLVLVESRLRDLGARVQSASNGKAAVALTLEMEKAKTPFDLILMDLQMPIMDGLEAVRILRQRGFTKPIVALTANRDSNKEAIAAGCNSILLKPADQESLLGIIVSLVRKADVKH